MDFETGHILLPECRVDFNTGHIPLPECRVDIDTDHIPLPECRVDFTTGHIPLPVSFFCSNYDEPKPSVINFLENFDLGLA